MYLGVKHIDYEILESYEFYEMKWNNTEGSNYLSDVSKIIDKYFSISIVFEFHIKNLLSLILENVHDHGSSFCILSIGKNQNGHVIEIYEPNGGFDLKLLPQGKGGCGFREIKKSKCIVSHSHDAKRTFISISKCQE